MEGDKASGFLKHMFPVADNMIDGKIYPKRTTVQSWK